MTKLAKRWTKDEESRAIAYIESTSTASTLPEVIAEIRRIDRNAIAKMNRRAAHIYRNGQASANKWY